MRPAAFGADARIPVHVLTGFLGSGKTTFLRHLLGEAEFADTAVVINELGEIGLDHLLVREVAEDVVLLASGCLCCAVRDDLVSTLAEMLEMAARGEIPPFRRIVVETTGLADPAPILQAVMSDFRLRGYRVGEVVATVDGVSGSGSVARFSEAVQQVALADCVVLTKSDLAEPWRLDALQAEIAAINPAARRFVSSKARFPGALDLFGGASAGRALSAEAWRAAPRTRHSQGVESFSVAVDRAVEWPIFVDWLELLLAGRGQSILRVKGLLAVAGDDPRPVVIQGVQHVVYPPERLPGWPDGVAKGWLVFIARDLNKTAIENALPGVFSLT